MTADTSFLTSPPALRLRGPTDLLVAVPYLLGFVPEQSLVVVALDDSNEVALVARVDLPDLDRAAGDIGLAGDIGQRIGAVAARAGGSTAVAVVYPAASRPETSAAGDCDDDDLWREFAAAVDTSFAAQSVDLIDCLVVVQRKWWSLLCTDAACCPGGGRDLPAAGTTEAEARAVLAGLNVLPTRADLSRQLAPAPPAERDAVEALMSPVALDPREGLRLVDAALARRPDVGLPSVLAPQEAADLLRAAADSRIRDAVSLCTSPDQGAAAESLWTELVGLAPNGWLAGPASLLAAAAYQDGNGVLAGLAAEAALGEDPQHMLAGQLIRALEVGMGPKELRPVFRLGSSAARAVIEAMT